MVASPRPALAESDRDRAAARAAADAGADAFDQQRYADAVELFGRAEKLVHATPHLLFIARSLVKLGRLVEAHETYLKIQRERLAPNAPNAFKRAQAEAEKEIEEVAPRLAYATVSLDGASSDAVQVLMDDAVLPSAVIGIAFPVDPGTHVFRAQAGTDKSADVTARFAEGGRQSVVLKIKLSAKPGASDSSQPGGTSGDTGKDGVEVSLGGASVPSEPHRASSGKGLLIAGSVLAGIGAIGTGVGIYFLASASGHRSRADDLFGQCDPSPDRCSTDQQAYIKQQDSLANQDNKRALYGLIPGIPLVIGGAALIIVNVAQGSSSASTPRTTLVGGSNWVGVQHSF